MTEGDGPLSNDIQDAGAPFQPPRKSGCMRYWWLILLLILLPIVSCIALGIFGFGAAMTLVKAPIDAAVKAMTEDEEIAGRLGTPLEASTTFGIDNFASENGNGHASLEFNVTGPDGSAQVSGEMKQFAGEWSPDDLTITFDDDTEVKLPR